MKIPRLARFVLTGSVMLGTLVAPAASLSAADGTSWKAYREELKLAPLASLAPPVVPDEQNFAMIPYFAEMRIWLAGEATEGEETPRFHGDLDPFKLGPGEPPATLWGERDAPMDLRPWAEFIGNPEKLPAPRVVLDRLAAQGDALAEISAGLRRAHLRWPSRYADGMRARLPSYLLMRYIAQTLRLRASARLEAGDRVGAREDAESLILLGHKLGGAHELVAIMIGGAIENLGLNVVRDGLRSHLWTEADLAAFEKVLPGESAMAAFKRSFDAALVACVHYSEQPGNAARQKAVEESEDFTPAKPGSEALWEQNLLDLAQTLQAYRAGLRRDGKGTLDTQVFAQLDAALAASKGDPRRFLARELSGRFGLSYARLVGVETMRLQAKAALDLERRFQKDGRYPAEFTVPDAIGFQPQVYRPSVDGKRFTLYSIGWNNRDDGGTRGEDETTGDWPWEVDKVAK